MKKFILLILCFALPASKLVSSDIFSKYSHLDLYADSNKTMAFNTIFPFGEFRFSFQEEKYNFGVCATSVRINKKYPFTLKAGNLSTGGILSKMNNPLLSSSTSPFSTGIPSVNPITASLPGNTNFSKPMTSFMELAYSNNKNPLKNLKFNCLYIPESDTTAASLFSEFSPLKNKLNIKASFCTGLFPHKEKSISSWFTNELYYHQDNLLASYFQLSFDFKHFLTAFSAGLYETPFGSISYTHRLDNKIITKNFIFNFSLFYNPNIYDDLILTSSDKTLEDCLQFKSGIQYKYVIGRSFPIFVKTGFQTYFNFKLSQTEHPVKLAGGIQFSSQPASLSLSTAVSAIENSQNMIYQNFKMESVQFQIKNTINLWQLVPSLNISATIKPAEDFSNYTNTYKFTNSLSYSQKVKLTAQGSFSLTHKEHDFTGKKLSGSVTAKFMWKKINTTIKLTGNIEM